MSAKIPIVSTLSVILASWGMKRPTPLFNGAFEFINVVFSINPKDDIVKAVNYVWKNIGCKKINIYKTV